MKKIYILLVVAVLYSNYTYTQTLSNKLTEQEFDQIKINNILIGDLIDTRGDYTKLEAMFGDDLQQEVYDLPTNGIKFWNNQIEIRFEEDDFALAQFILYYPTTGNTGETDHPKPEQTDHLKGWRKLPNFAGEDFQFSADLV